MKKNYNVVLIALLTLLIVFLLSCNDQEPVGSSSVETPIGESTPIETPSEETPSEETPSPDPCQNGHTEVTDAAVAPTCTENGLSEGSHCSVCSAVIKAQAEIDALGHTEGEWIVESEATCNTEGKRTRKCTLCGETVTVVITEALCSSEEKVTVSLKDYSIVYADSDNSYILSEINRFANILKSSTDLTNAPIAESKATSAAKEILIGLTSRSESRIAYEGIHGKGYTVKAIGDKIVIVGTDDTMTLAAINYFINNCIDEASKTLSLKEKHSLCGADYIPFANSKGSSYIFVFDHDLNVDRKHNYVDGSSSKPDYPFVLLERLVKNIADYNKANVNAFTVKTDVESTQPDGFEVLLGIVDRQESNEYRLTLDAHEYGFKITEKKIIIAAHNDAALEDAVNAFAEFYNYIVAYVDGKLPVGYEYKGQVTDQNWITDFPRPDGEGINISFAQHNNDDSLQILYSGKGVGVEAFLAYCAKLEAAGYVIVTKNDDPGSMGNYFRTYKNEEKQHAIYVAYNAFKSQDVYKDANRQEDHVLKYTVNGRMVYYTMRDYDPCIRIVSAPLSKAYLPSDEIIEDNYDRATQKITESSVTAMRYFENSVGMGYIIQLEDGSFFIVDGGNKHNDDDRVLYATLVELYKKSHGGKEPSVENPIHIKAWLITHSHGDHFNTMSAFLLRYAKLMKTVTMDYLIGNFPEISTVYTVEGEITTMGNGTTISKLQGYVEGGFKYIKAHTGQVLYLANLKVEIMMTTEDHAPFRIDNSNDTNTVTKLTIRTENKDTTWMMLGDSCIYQSRWLCAMWGGNSYNTSEKLYENSYLKSDMVQLAHHGNIGCEIALYKTIQGEVLWFPHNSSSYNGYVFSSSAHWRVKVDKYVARSLKTIKYIFVSGVYNKDTYKDYHDSITLEFTADGPNYNDIWGVNYRQTNKAVVSPVPFNSGTGKIVDSPVIKK